MYIFCVSDVFCEHLNWSSCNAKFVQHTCFVNNKNLYLKRVIHSQFIVFVDLLIYLTDSGAVGTNSIILSFKAMNTEPCYLIHRFIPNV